MSASIEATAVPQKEPDRLVVISLAGLVGGRGYRACFAFDTSSRGVSRLAVAALDHTVDSRLAARADADTVGDGRAGGQEHVVFGGTTSQVRPWPDQNMLTQTKRILGGGPKHSVLHDDAVAAELDPTTFGGEHARVIQEKRLKSQRSSERLKP